MAYDTLPPWHEYPRQSSAPRVEHRVHIEEEIMHMVLFRWVCSCGDHGSWSIHKATESVLGAHHVREFA